MNGKPPRCEERGSGLPDCSTPQATYSDAPAHILRYGGSRGLGVRKARWTYESGCLMHQRGYCLREAPRPPELKLAREDRRSRLVRWRADNALGHIFGDAAFGRSAHSGGAAPAARRRAPAETEEARALCRGVAGQRAATTTLAAAARAMCARVGHPKHDNGLPKKRTPFRSTAHKRYLFSLKSHLTASSTTRAARGASSTLRIFPAIASRRPGWRRPGAPPPPVRVPLHDNTPHLPPLE